MAEGLAISCEEPDGMVSPDGVPKSFDKALKSFRAQLKVGCEDLGEDLARFRFHLKHPQNKQRPERQRKPAGDLVVTGAFYEMTEKQRKELLLDCITKAPMTDEEGEDRCKKCGSFLDHFFELPMSEKAKKVEKLTFEVRKDAFLQHVASVHSKFGGDPQALRKGMKEKLEEMHAQRPGERVLRWSAEADVAVDVMLEVLDREWTCARDDADDINSLDEKGCIIFMLKRRNYEIKRFRRAVRACELRLWTCGDRRRDCEVLGQPTPISRDLKDFREFADRCVARALAYEGLDEERKKAVLDEILEHVDAFPMLRKDGQEQIREALYALRSFMRTALRKRFPEESEYLEIYLPQLEKFEEALFTVAPPRFHFASRLPILVLGKLWTEVYSLLLERRKELGDNTDDEVLEKIYSRFDLPALIRALAYDRSGKPKTDADEMRGKANLLGQKLRCIMYARCQKSLSTDSKTHFGDDAWHPCYYLSAAERECWQDFKAQELLRQLFIQGQTMAFSLPFLGSFRIEQLSEELGGKGVVVLHSPYTRPRQPAVDCMLRFSLESRIFSRAHAPYFKILPVFYQIRNTALKHMLGQINTAGASCWCAGALQKIQDESEMRAIFSGKHIPLSKNEGNPLSFIFGDSRNASKPAKMLLQDVFAAQRAFFHDALSVMKGAVPQTEEWTNRLEAVIGFHPGDDVKAIVFSSHERGWWGPGVLVLPAEHKSDGRLQDLFSERGLSVFWEDGRPEMMSFFMFKLRKGQRYSPCYKFGGADWSEVDLTIVRNYINDEDKFQLIKHGVKAVLFSDVPSGLLHEELVCCLPVSLRKEKKLLRVLACNGVALYVWGFGVVVESVSGEAYQQCEEPRALTLDMIFDESENAYDFSVFHRRDAQAKDLVREHVEKFLKSYVPESFAEVAPGGDGAVTDGTVLSFLREDQMKVRDNEDDLSWKIMKKQSPMVRLVILSPEAPPQNRLLTLPNKRRLCQSKCLGRCGRFATQEVPGTGRLVACDSCQPWEEVQLVDGLLEACQFRSKDSGVCGAPAVKKLKGESDAAPKSYCHDHATLVRVSDAERAGCGEEHDKALLLHDVTSSLNVFEEKTMSENFIFNSLKVSGFLFGDAKISAGCLEVQMLREVRVRSYLREREAAMKKVKLIITRDDATAGLLDVSLRAMGLHGCAVWSLDHLASLTDADFGNLVERFSFLRAESMRAFVKALDGDRKQVQWISGKSFTETGHFEQIRGDGELPADKKESERSEGLFVGELPNDLLGMLPEPLRRQLEHRSPKVQKMQDRLAKKMWRFRALAQHLMRSTDARTRSSWVEGGRSAPPFEADADVTWMLVYRIFDHVDKISGANKRGQCWGDVLSDTLDEESLRLRTELAPWCLMDLSNVSRCDLHAGSLEEPTKLRPALWQEVTGVLDWNPDFATHLKEAHMVQGKFVELQQKALASGGPRVACGLVNSVLPNYRASLAAKNLRPSTPEVFVRQMLEPRIEEIENLCELVEILFQNEHRWEQCTEQRRVPLKIKHVFMLAQEYFWSPSYRGRLVKVLKEIKRLFDLASTSVEKRRATLDVCFSITGCTVKDHVKHNFSGRRCLPVRVWRVMF